MEQNHKMVCIDKEVYEYLRSKAEGFDSVNKTLRRVLGLPQREDQRKHRSGRKKKEVKK